MPKPDRLLTGLPLDRPVSEEDRAKARKMIDRLVADVEEAALFKEMLGL